MSKTQQYFKHLMLLLLAPISLLLVSPSKMMAASPCTFTTSGTTLTLNTDCTTDAPILVPAGFTLDGAGYTITAVDPTGGHFTGAVVRNGGSTAHVTNLTITTSGLANVCDAGGARLRGIMFEGAAGSITRNTILNINQGASGCQEGNALEVRNFGHTPGRPVIEVAHNKVYDYQKTGIVANGDVEVNIHHNSVGASATQANLAANSIQLGFGATGSVTHNLIDGNSWCCDSAAATAILLFLVDGVYVSKNNLGGNADVGIYVFGDDNLIDNNRIFESGADGFYDIGLGNYSPINATPTNLITNNKVRGFSTPYDGVTGGKNKVIPGPQMFP